MHRRCIAAPRRCPPGPPLAQRRRRGQRRSMLMPLINLRNRFISPRRASRAAPQRKSTEKCIRTYDDRLSPGHLKNLTGASFRMWPTRIRFVNEQQPPLPLLSFFSFLSLQTFLSFSLSLLLRNVWIRLDADNSSVSLHWYFSKFSAARE